jgi:hypothetical protein
MGGKLKELIASVICIALSAVALFLTAVLFYGIVLLIFHYGFGVELGNPFQSSGAGMG